MERWGVIAEYNPFHCGHEYQLDWMRSQGAEQIVTAMSGNFVQRGGPALFSKWARAKAAVLGGADLVAEIPVYGAMAPAPDFALAGVWTLAQLGVQILCFGSECGNLEQLQAAAACCEQIEADERMGTLLKQGMSYPVARGFLIGEIYGEELKNLVSSPNDMLGIEYLRAMKYLAPQMKAAVLPRKGVCHDSGAPAEGFASASYVRRCILDGNFSEWKRYVPKQAVEIYKQELKENKAPCREESLDRTLIWKLRTSSAEQLAMIRDVTEGLENRLAEAGKRCNGFRQCEDFLSGKRYTRARVRRILWNVMLDIFKEQYPKQPDVFRILGIGAQGREILKDLKGHEACICMKPAQFLRQGNATIELAVRSTDLYSICSPKLFPAGRECTEAMFVMGK